MPPLESSKDFPPRWAEFPGLGRVCRFGLATRGGSALTAEDIRLAVDHGVNYLNWCGIGHSDGLVDAVRTMGERRRNVFVAVQFFARTADDAQGEIDEILDTLGTDYVDVLTYYYVEREAEWNEITGPGGAAEVVEWAKASGVVRSIGLTSHHRRFAASIADRRGVDMLMIRYNAAHRGAEPDVFPITTRLGIPAVTYTALRWGALLHSTPEDPTGFRIPSPADWYRFVLANPDVTVCVMAPQTSEELRDNLDVLTNWQGLSPRAYEALRRHGDRVYKHDGGFP